MWDSKKWPSKDRPRKDSVAPGFRTSTKGRMGFKFYNMLHYSFSLSFPKFPDKKKARNSKHNRVKYSPK